MGNDSPLAVLSDKNKPLFNYFKQLFAQVTNPPIDPIREAIVMSLNSFIGPKPNLLDINAVNPPMRLEVTQPVLDFDDMARLRAIEKHTHGKFKSYELDITYPLAWGRKASRPSWRRCAPRAWTRIRGGHNILIVTDRAMSAPGGDPGAAGAVGRPPPPGARGPAHHGRPGGGDRQRARGASLSPCSPATAPRRCIPYLAMETLADMHRELPGDLSADKAIYNYVKAIGKGLSKIMSKMGVSARTCRTAAPSSSRPSAWTRRLVEKYFRGTATQVGGIGVFEVAEEALRMHRAAFGDDPVLAGMLDAGGEYAWRVRGEEHMWTPDAIAKLQHSARAGKFDTYKEYAQIINDQSRRHMTLRGLFEFKLDPSRRSRSTRWSRRPRSSSASPPARCRWARSPPRRTPRWPSP